MTNTPGGPPAGWYDDPHGGTRLRYWDGHTWTEHYHEVPAPAPGPAAPFEPTSHVETPPGPAATGQPPVATPNPIASQPAAAPTAAGSAGRGGVEVWQIGAVILAAWGAISCIRALRSDDDFDHVPPFIDDGSTGIGDAFTSTFGGFGLLGNAWDWFRESIGTSPFFEGGFMGVVISPLFLLTVAATVAAILALVPGPRQVLTRRLAALLAFAHVALFALIWMPLFGDDFGPFLTWGSFLTGMLLASLLPAAGGAMILVGVPFSAAGGADTSRSFAPTVYSEGTPIVPVSNGLRFGAYLLDGLLAVLTLFIGWLVWSLILWGRGQTPGKQLLGLTVIDHRTRTNATWGTMAVRELVGKGLLGGITFGITSIVSAFMILLGERRQGIWDSIAHTSVVTTTR